MAVFPSIWELLLPNFNIFTVIGIILILIAFFGLAYLPYVGNKLKGFLILVGAVLIWGVSIIQDFLSSQGGAVITFGVLTVAIIGFVLFYEPKSSKTKSKNGSGRIKF